ncbi:MAG TPA: SRPBCC family protein [Actinomycetota bacterium]|nr:SRPBCC family protein [Actinomycetota bacterium]
MTVLTVQADVDAQPEHVWTVVSDPRNLTEWDRHITAVHGVPADGLRRGSEYDTEIRFMGIRTKVHADVLDIDPPRYSKIRLVGLLDATVETFLEPLDGGRTHLRHRVDYRFRGGPLGDLGARVVRAMGGASLLRRGVEAQKRQAEALKG